MSLGRVRCRWYDGYEPLHVATMLLEMSFTAECQAQIRLGAAEASRRLGRLDGGMEEFEVAATALEEASVRVATCGRRLRQLAERLSGVSVWAEPGRTEPTLR
jgi:hypothetical protein